MTAKKPSSVRTTVDLPGPLFRQAKIYAATQGITLKELLIQGLQLALAPDPPPARPSSLPSSGQN